MPFGLPHKPVQSTLPVPSWYFFFPSRNPSQGTCHGNMAAALIAARRAVLSPAFIADMDNSKGGVYPWALPQWLVTALHDFHGEHNLIFQIPHGLHAPSIVLVVIIVLRAFASTAYRSRPSSASPNHVSWVPVGAVLTDIVGRPTDERWDLIRELACLARHCDWGVDAVRRGGTVRYRFKYFSSVVQLHDPTGGLPPLRWVPGSTDRRGKSIRFKAYGSFYKQAAGEGPATIMHSNCHALTCPFAKLYVLVCVVAVHSFGWIPAARAPWQ